MLNAICYALLRAQVLTGWAGASLGSAAYFVHVAVYRGGAFVEHVMFDFMAY